MTTFIKASAGIILALILEKILQKQGKDMSLLLSIVVCTMVAAAAISFLQPVLSFFSRLQIIGNLNSSLLNVLLKAVGVGILSEVLSLICSDAGNAALGKTLQLLASSVVLYLSIPLLEELLKLMDTILGAI